MHERVKVGDVLLRDELKECREKMMRYVAIQLYWPAENLEMMRAL